MKSGCSAERDPITRSVAISRPRYATAAYIVFIAAKHDPIAMMIATDVPMIWIGFPELVSLRVILGLEHAFEFQPLIVAHDSSMHRPRQDPWHEDKRKNIHPGDQNPPRSDSHRPIVQSRMRCRPRQTLPPPSASFREVEAHRLHWFPRSASGCFSHHDLPLPGNEPATVRELYIRAQFGVLRASFRAH